MTNSDVALLASSLGLELSDMELLAPVFKPHTFSARSIFAAQGERCDAIGFIIDGLAKMETTREDGEASIAGFCQRGEFFGSCVPLFESAILPYSIVFIENTKALIADVTGLAPLTTSSPEFANAALSQVGHLLKKKAERESEFLNLDDRARFEKFQLENNELFARLSNSDLAKYLGIRPETASRFKASSRR
jgi:CRP-like cAMP-binding protein